MLSQPVIQFYLDLFKNDWFYAEHGYNIDEEIYGWAPLENEQTYYIDGKLAGIIVWFEYNQDTRHIFSDDPRILKSLLEKCDHLASLGKPVLYSIAIAVLPEFRRQGIARTMLSQLYEKHRGEIFVTDVDNESSLPLYGNSTRDLLEDNYWLVYGLIGDQGLSPLPQSDISV